MAFDKRKFVAGLITGMIIFGALTFFAIITMAVSPSIVYAYPADDATFVDVWRGHGVNVTVNVSDGDGDLQQVVLKWNNSGTWATFYDSGALGGVSYHNVTVLNTNFTGSWTTYEWQICAKDGTGWTNTTYSFTTEYVWGDPVMVAFDDLNDLLLPQIIKNNTNDYFISFILGDRIYTRHSPNMFFADKSNILVNDTGLTSNDMVANYLFNHDGKLYIVYERENNGIQYEKKCWNGSAWVSPTSADFWTYSNRGQQPCAIYYDGAWQTIGQYYNTSSNTAIKHIRGSTPFSGTTIDSLDSYSGYFQFYPSLAIFDGYMVLTYRDSGNDLHWKIYDGVNWVDKGDIDLDIGDYGLTLIKDPVNNQLVLIYVNASGNMYYRTLSDISGSWSSPHLLFTPASGKTVKHPYAQFIDRRIVVVFSYNLRGTYDIYMISAPEYLSSASGGVLKQYNRIQFPDAVPNQQHVNSSVFYFENIDSRNITQITWNFADIGSIQCENNFVLWGSTDNATWTKIGTADASGVVVMNATTWVGGMPWATGEKRYFKLEILNIGSVPEDLHSCDEAFLLEVNLE